ncbi:LysR family transcriptional regulator [Brenneria izadpanahii]|uniref:LysR family transcriptional regulator n=1 Tax=Brenneria izadpanahii TaxID=2722756 RepID=A0ABX7UWR3_9GAMM|nr:LysR family transcriptional regulator [Brenneria izadpanahii]QTF08600.1 LysR family transcriptional regulator [Brenneria izadpanahii]
MVIKYESLNDVELWAFSRFVRYFCATAQHGTMRRAGDELHVSPSSVDRQILSIEEKLGVPLFERLPQGLRLTSAGELVLHRINCWQQDMYQLKTQIEDLKGMHRGHVTMAIVEGTIEWATSILAGFHQKYPGISYEIQVYGADQVVRLVLENIVDIGLSVNPAIMSGLKVLTSVEFRLGIIAASCHPLSQRSSARLSDCIDYPVVIPDSSLTLRGVIDRLLATSATEFNVVATSNSLQMVKQLVSQNVGIGLATYIDVANEVKSGKMCFIPLENKNVHPSLLSLCLAENRQLSRVTTELVNEFDNEMNALLN